MSEGDVIPIPGRAAAGMAGELPRSVAEGLSAAQRDGRACIGCGRAEGALVPTGRVDGVQVFAHAGCSRRRPSR